MTNYLEYFKEGFKLAKKNFHIYIILAILALLPITILLIGNPTVLFTLSIISLLIGVISISFNISLPAIIDSNLKKPKEIISISFNNFKRIIGWLLVLGVIFIVIIFPLTLINIQSKNLNSEIFSIIVTLIIRIFGFWSMFFSIDKFGVIDSIKKSYQLSIKNLKFVYLPLPYSLAIILLQNSFPKLFITVGITQIIFTLITIFINFTITCSFYLFWKKNYKD